MAKTKHNPPQKSKSNFIEFSRVQTNYLNEVRNRQIKEFGEALKTVYDELGIREKILKAPPGAYKLTQGFSGLDVLPVPHKK